MATSQDFENMSTGMLRRKLFLSLLLPSIFIAVLWIIRFIQVQFDVSLVSLGIFPLDAKGIPGILLSPMIHADTSHLINNTLPLLILGTAVFYFYPEVSLRVIGFSWVITGILVWIFGRQAWHIGASGIIYGLASFLFISGIIRRYFRMLAVSMLVVFIYGSMVWGMFPRVYVDVSWEAHMLGAITGIFLAVVYRHRGPQRPPPFWIEDEEESEGEEEELPENIDRGPL